MRKFRLIFEVSTQRGEFTMIREFETESFYMANEEGMETVKELSSRYIHWSLTDVEEIK